MTSRSVTVLVGLLLVASFLVGMRTNLFAQQPPTADSQARQRRGFPSVITSHGFVVEEVRVGGSCVIVVSRAEGNAQPVAVPCQ